MGYEDTRLALEKIIGDREFKILLIDSAGNIISDLKLSDLLSGLKGTGDRDLTTLEADIESIDNKVATETTLSSVLSRVDVPLSTILRIRVYEQDFEDGTTDTTVSNATQTVQSTEVYAGSYALKVTITATQTGYVETPQRLVSPNQQVTFAFAHKEDANITDVKLIVVWYRAAGGIISTEEFTLTPSTTWTVDERTVTAPSKAATMGLRMQATAGASDGNVYLDEMTIDLVGQILRVDGAGNLKVADSDVLDELKLNRWGRDVDPEWVHAAEVTAPSAGASLVSKTVGTGKTGYIYGFFISAGEANDFKINWTSGGSSYSIRIPFSGKGALHYIDFAALNEGLGADAGTSITITNVNAGSAGVVYQARLFYAEV